MWKLVVVSCSFSTWITADFFIFAFVQVWSGWHLSIHMLPCLLTWTALSSCAPCVAWAVQVRPWRCTCHDVDRFWECFPCGVVSSRGYICYDMVRFWECSAVRWRGGIYLSWRGQILGVFPVVCYLSRTHLSWHGQILGVFPWECFPWCVSSQGRTCCEVEA